MRKNRWILERYFSEGVTQLACVQLKDAGFDFSNVTGYFEDSRSFYCYDYGYRYVSKLVVRIIKSDVMICRLSYM